MEIILLGIGLAGAAGAIGFAIYKWKFKFISYMFLFMGAVLAFTMSVSEFHNIMNHVSAMATKSNTKDENINFLLLGVSLLLIFLGVVCRNISKSDNEDEM